MFKDRRLRAAVISIAANVGLVILKLVGSRLSLSAAMKADALHSTSDIVVSALVLLSIWMTVRSVREAQADDEEEPGEGETDSADEEDGEEDNAPLGEKVTGENLTALLVSLVLIGTALGFVVSALTGYAYELERVWIAIAIVWVCILISHFLAEYKIRVGREEGSISLEADGYHSRMDKYSSIIVFVGLLGYFVGLRLDAIASAIVSFLVLKTGVDILYSSIRGLVASEVFTYQSLAGVRNTALGRGLAPLYDRLLARRMARLRERNAAAARFVVRRRKRLGVVFAAFVLAAYLFSGFYRIQPDEVGIELVCGKWDGQTHAPGLHYRLPSPVSRLHRVKPMAVRQLEFGFRTVARRGTVTEPSAYLWESIHRTGIYEKAEPEAIMLTGDVNEIDLNLVVEYCVAEGKVFGFLFNVKDSEALVRAATESTVRRVVGQRALTELLTTARPEIEQAVHTHLQALLDTQEYRACIRVTAVRLQDVHPPVDVVPAFRRVATAREDRMTSINEAQGYRNWTIPRSRGFASQIKADADAYRIEQKYNAEGDASHFNQTRAAFRVAPEVVAFTMYMDRLEESLPTLRKVILSSELSAPEAGDTLQKYFMMGQFLKQGLAGAGQADTWYGNDGE